MAFLKRPPRRHVYPSPGFSSGIFLFVLLILCFSVPSAALADREIVVTFVGDCTLGSEEHERAKPTSFDSYVLNYGFDYPFSGVYSVIANDDLTVANLEGVFYNYEANKVSKTYNFRAPTEFAQILPLGSVEAVSLANNHTEDYGAQGIRSTVDALAEVGIPWFATTEYADDVYVYEVARLQDRLCRGLRHLLVQQPAKAPRGHRAAQERGLRGPRGCDARRHRIQRLS